jgi:hypothetical protein
MFFTYILLCYASFSSSELEQYKIMSKHNYLYLIYIVYTVQHYDNIVLT